MSRLFDAPDTSKFLVLDASAGSGKTYTLVQHILLKVLSHADMPNAYQKVLAMTFTNNAASEMKQRLLKHLLDFSAADDPAKDGFFKPLWEKLQCTPEELQRRAHASSQHMLHHYSTLRVGTIDQFTHQLVRTFTRDLNMSDNFEVRLDLEAMIAEALDLLYSTLHERPQLSKMWVDWVHERMKSEKSHNPDRELKKEGKQHMNEQDWLMMKQLPSAERLVEIEKELRAELDTIVQKGRDFSDEVIDFIKTRGYDPGSLKYYKDVKKHLLTDWRNLLKNKLYDKSQLWKAEPKGSPDADWEDLLTRCKAFNDSYLLRLDLLKQAKDKLQSLAAASSLMEAFQQLEEEQNVKALSAFNKIIHEQLQKEPAAFIYERLGERYWYFYIDEFQDTSEVQFYNMHPLIEHYLTKNDQPNTALIVGDAKQSIYRWRGGNAELFIGLVQNQNPVNRLGRAPEGHALYERQTIRMEDNWRSNQVIVDFNNQLFPHLAASLTSEQHKETYSAQSVHQNPRMGEEGEGFVEIDYLHFDGDQEETYDEVACNKTLELIRELKTRYQEIGVEASNKRIALLVRRNKDAETISNFLVREGVPVLSADSVILGSSFEGRILAATAALYLNPEDKEARFELAYSLEKLHLLPEGMEAFVFHRAIVQEGLRALEPYFPQWGALRQTFNSMYHFGATVFHVFGLLQRSNAMVDAGLDLLYTYQIRGGSFANLPSWWAAEAPKKSVITPESTDAVRVMTIHKAKGLEFDHVIVPFTMQVDVPGPEEHWSPVQGAPLHEEIPVFPLRKRNDSKELFPSHRWDEIENQKLFDFLNVIYVAFTRPVKSLHILFNAVKPDSLARSMRDFLELGDDLHFERGQLAFEADPEQDRTAGKVAVASYPFKTVQPAHLRMAKSAPKGWETGEVDLRKYGTALHRILQLPESLQFSALDRLYRTGQFPERLKDQTSTNLTALRKAPAEYGVPADAQWFAERAFLTSDGEYVRPDLIAVSGDERWVFDYKTGTERGADVDQLDRYVSELTAFWGETSGHLLYLMNHE